MATAEQIQGWLARNADKAGTPDFVTMTDELSKLSSTPTAPVTAAPAEPYAYTDQGVPIGSGTGGGAGGNPNGAFATTGRVISGAATGIPDLVSGIANAAGRAAGPGGSFGMYGVPAGEQTREIPYLGQTVNRTMGVPEMDPKADLTRRLLEGGGSALLGGGLNSILSNMSKASPAMVSQLWQAAKTLTTNVAAPTAASEFGGQGGEALAEYLKLDPQTGALLGSLLGGGITGAVPGAYDRYSHNWYADRAKPNAPEIAAAMERMGGEATPGQLGNNAIQQLERTLGSSTGAKQYIDERRQSAYDTMGDALNRAADARGRVNDPSAPPVAYTGTPGMNQDVGPTRPIDTGPVRAAGEPLTPNVATPLPGGTSDIVTPGTIGDKLKIITRDSAEGLRQGGEEAQARLMDRVGSQTPVLLRPLQDAGARLQLPGSGVEPSMKANIAHRLGPAIEAMLFRLDNDRRNQPFMFDDQGQRMMGHNGGPPMPEEKPRIRRAGVIAESPLSQAESALESYYSDRGGPQAPPSRTVTPPAPPVPPGWTMGNRGAFVDQGSVAAPYDDVRAYRTELGRNLDLPGGQRLGPAAQLYGPATDIMRVAAERQGVPRQDFENAMARTHAIETTPAHIGDPTGDYNTLMDIAVKKPDEAFEHMRRGEQNAADLGTIEATQHPMVPGLFGDYMKLIGRNTINDLDVSAAGARQTAGRLEDMHPESKATMFGDQAGAMQDVETGARAYNYPTSGTGLNRATGAAAERGAATTVIAQALEKMGGPGGLLTLGALPLINRMRAGGLNSPQAMNALRGGPAAPMNTSDLVASLNAAAAANDRLQRPRVIIDGSSRRP
jgi:hypothetical protein